MKKIIVTRAITAAVFAGAVAVAIATGCSAKVCSSTEESACTTTYTDCINAAAAAASRTQCEKCVTDYCNCYDSCGNTCDKNKLNAQCGP